MGKDGGSALEKKLIWKLGKHIYLKSVAILLI